MKQFSQFHLTLKSLTRRRVRERRRF